MKLLTGTVMNYEWGSRSALPALLGVPEDGKPQAEYWLGAHPAGPALIDGHALDAWLVRHPEAVQGTAAERFGERFPFLMKYLAADRPLSLQAHPNAAEARAGYQAEQEAGVPLDAPERGFKDPHPKPEMLVATTDFEALAGFRDPAQTLELFDALDVSESLEPIIGPLRHRNGEAALAEVFLDCLTADGTRRHNLEEVVAACVRHVDDDGELGRFARAAVRLDEFFPGDTSLLGALLLNCIHLEPGQGLRVDTGVLHAYLRGEGIEILASSDNVLRGGLTNKHVDVSALISVVDFTPLPPPLVEPAQQDEGLFCYPSTAEEFALWRAELTPGRQVAVPASDSPRIMLVTAGSVDVHEGNGITTLRQGQAAFLASGEHAGLTGEGMVFIGAPGLG